MNPSASQPKEIVVVAEDSAPNRAVLTLMLRKMGFETMEFEDGDEAWAAVDRLAAEGGERRLCAVVSDMMMPKMDGLEFLRRVRNDARITDLPFVLLTAVSEKDYIHEARALRVDGYVLKPVTYKRMEAKLREIFPMREFPSVL